jgi:hypothetical protein
MKSLIKGYGREKRLGTAVLGEDARRELEENITAGVVTYPTST